MGGQGRGEEVNVFFFFINLKHLAAAGWRGL